jgi:hypothetical protein
MKKPESNAQVFLFKQNLADKPVQNLKPSYENIRFLSFSAVDQLYTFRGKQRFPSGFH